MGTSISFKRPDGKDTGGYLANAARGNAPGVVVIQEWWGLSSRSRALCDRFAVAGFDALAPDLYAAGGAVSRHRRRRQRNELAGFHRRTNADGARRRAISRQERRQRSG